MEQQRNRWKWYLLRVTALLQSAFAVLMFAALLYSLKDEPIRWWSEDFWATVAVIVWGLLVLFCSYGQLKAAATLLHTKTSIEGFVPTQHVLWVLIAATIALIIHLFISGSSLYAYLQLSTATQKPLDEVFYRIFIVLFCFMLLAVVNYLLSIKAYFELRFMRLAAEEALLMQLNNPMAKPQY